jgi:hypothetical protein
LFEQQERLGRHESEGPAWTISAEETSRLGTISLALFNAIRRESHAYSASSNKS